MLDLISRLLGRDQTSAGLAKDRLHLVLIHDRTDLSPGVLDKLRDEIIGVISRHVEIDPAEVSIEMAQEGRQHRLIADIPLKPARRRSSLG